MIRELRVANFENMAGQPQEGAAVLVCPYYEQRGRLCSAKILVFERIEDRDRSTVEVVVDRLGRTLCTSVPFLIYTRVPRRSVRSP